MSPRPIDAERFGWRAAAVCGCLWGVATTLAVSLSQPLGDLSVADSVAFVGGLLPAWTASGLVWALGSKLVERARAPWAWFPVLLAASLAVNEAVNVLPLPALGRRPLSSDLAHLLVSVPIEGLLVYDVWNNLVYGGLYFVGYVATRRTLRLRKRLAELTTARTEAETALRQARLDAVRGQVQPALLLEALDALRDAYAVDRAAGEEMFDLIVAFLRAAMPGLRTGASTLGAEFAVVERYRDLRRALQGGGRLWRLELAAPPPELPFPSLRLLPALDRISRALPADAAVALTAESAADAFVVRIGVDATEPLSAAVLHRLRRDLRRDLGPRLATAGAQPRSQIGEIRLPLAA